MQKIINLKLVFVFMLNALKLKMVRFNNIALLALNQLDLLVRLVKLIIMLQQEYALISVEIQQQLNCIVQLVIKVLVMALA